MALAAQSSKLNRHDRRFRAAKLGFPMVRGEQDGPESKPCVFREVHHRSKAGVTYISYKQL